MNIVFLGDSITDMNRNRDIVEEGWGWGSSYAFIVKAILDTEAPCQHHIYNRGNGGERITNMYARAKKDCWSLNPDVVSIMSGRNDFNEATGRNGIDIQRFKRTYEALIEETKEQFPNVKIIVVEPFILDGPATLPQKEETHRKMQDYSNASREVAEKCGVAFVSLQDKFNELAKQYEPTFWLYDGVHPTAAGSKIIADEWLKVYRTLF